MLAVLVVLVELVKEGSISIGRDGSVGRVGRELELVVLVLVELVVLLLSKSNFSLRCLPPRSSLCCQTNQR